MSAGLIHAAVRNETLILVTGHRFSVNTLVAIVKPAKGANVNIIEALKKLESETGGITRDSVSIHRWDCDTWVDFQGCRATLNIGDLLADDWIFIEDDSEPYH